MAATISLTIGFNLDTGYFNFVDTSNYAAQGSPDTGVKGTLKITGPSGIVYQNAAFSTPVSATADITTAGGFVNNAIAIPLDANNEVQHGDYTIEYKVYVTGGTDAGQTFTLTPVTFNYCFEAPEVEITQTVDCVTATFTSTDDSDYDEEGVTPTVTRTHTVTEVADPSRTSLSNTNASNTVVYPDLYAGDYLTTLSSLLVYDFTSYTVTVTVTGNSTYEVACSTPCDVYCGIKGVWTAYQAYQASGDIKSAANSLEKFNKLTALYTLYLMAINCQETDDADGYLQDIQDIGGFTSSCCTTTGQIVPVQVKGDVFKVTSASSVLIAGSGTKSWTVRTGLAWSKGVTMSAFDASDSSNFMKGTCLAYSGTTLSMTVSSSGGSGTISNWVINIGS